MLILPYKNVKSIRQLQKQGEVYFVNLNFLFSPQINLSTGIV